MSQVDLSHQRLRAKLFILAEIEEKNPDNHQGRRIIPLESLDHRWSFDILSKWVGKRICLECLRSFFGEFLTGTLVHLLWCQYSSGHSLDGGHWLVCRKSSGHAWRLAACRTRGWRPWFCGWLRNSTRKKSRMKARPGMAIRPGYCWSIVAWYNMLIYHDIPMISSLSSHILTYCCDIIIISEYIIILSHIIHMMNLYINRINPSIFLLVNMLIVDGHLSFSPWMAPPVIGSSAASRRVAGLRPLRLLLDAKPRSSRGILNRAKRWGQLLWKHLEVLGTWEKVRSPPKTESLRCRGPTATRWIGVWRQSQQHGHCRALCIAWGEPNMVTYVTWNMTCHRDATEMPQRCHKDAAGADPFTWDFAAERVTERAGEVLGGRLSCPSGPSTSLNNNLNDWQHELLVAEGWGFQHSCFKYFLSLSSRLVQQHSGGVSSLSRRWSCWSAWIPQEVPSV